MGLDQGQFIRIAPEAFLQIDSAAFTKGCDELACLSVEGS